jgi:cyclopropane fatty-acyl-phospholipid synthase-like methyltransferase
MSQYDKATKTAQDYYNSDDADNFYSLVWGGEDIHIGLYSDETQDIKSASQKTVDYMASQLVLSDDKSILDIGSGYGGAMRRLCQSHPISTICLNLSEKENQKNLFLNREAKLDSRINIINGRFEEIPLENTSVDYVWSQDALLHSGNRGQVLKEVKRVLKEHGLFIFTDIMRKDDVETTRLQPILDRIHLPDLGTPTFYKDTLKQVGFREVEFNEMTHQLTTHYSKVLDQTNHLYDKIKDQISETYLDNMKQGLNYWIEGGENGLLTWGVFIAKV